MKTAIPQAGTPFTRLGLVSALFLALSATGCNDSGGSSSSPGGSAPPGGPPLIVDFALRKDIHLSGSVIGDALALDVDGDTIVDLVETAYVDQLLTIAFGIGDGTFLPPTPATVLPTVGRGWRLTAGDFDGNGLLDIAVANREESGAGQSAVEVFTQGPARVFAAGISLPTLVDPLDLAAAPIGGMTGGAPPDELFVALRSGFEVAVVQLQGGALVNVGTLESSNLSASGTDAGAPFSVAVIDIGGTGLLDVVAGEEFVQGGGPGRIVAYPRTGAATFDPSTLVMDGVSTPIVDNVGDTDANTFDDLGVAQLTGTDVLLFAGDAAGFSTVHAIDFGGATTSALFPDLNGDGFAEAVGTVLFQTSVQVHAATADFVWNDPVHYNVGLAPRAISVLDLMQDGIPDLCCSNLADVSFLIGAVPAAGEPVFRGARGYSTKVSNLSGPDVVDAGDLDNDGDADVVTSTVNQESISFLEGFGDGSFETQIVLPLAPTPDDEQSFLQIADIDQDGFLDVITSVHILNEVRLYRNQLTGAPGETFADAFVDPPPADIFPVGAAPLGIEVADVNNDLMPDVVVCNEDDATIQVLFNDAGTLVPGTPIVMPFRPKGPVCSDMDNDGDVDCAIFAGDGTSPENFSVAILEGDGTGNFVVTSELPVDGPSNNMVLGDLDEDGLVDVVVGQTLTTQDEVHLLENQSDGVIGLAFFPRRQIIGEGPSTPIVADADNDGHLDLVTPTTRGELKIAYGDGTGNFPTIEPANRGDLPVPRGTLSAAYVDTNGDGLPDLVMASHFSPFVWVGLNTSVPITQP